MRKFLRSRLEQSVLRLLQEKYRITFPLYLSINSVITDGKRNNHEKENVYLTRYRRLFLL